MTFEDFSSSLAGDRPPSGLSRSLTALWQDAKGNWDAAHGTAQDDPGRDAAWVHGYLHRKEGDQANAAYWYRRAGQPVAADALADEWARIVQALLDDEVGPV